MLGTNVPPTTRTATRTASATATTLSPRPTPRQLVDRQMVIVREQRDQAFDNHTAYEERAGHISLELLREYRNLAGLYEEMCRDYETLYGQPPPTTEWGLR